LSSGPGFGGGARDDEGAWAAAMQRSETVVVTESQAVDGLVGVAVDDVPQRRALTKLRRLRPVLSVGLLAAAVAFIVLRFGDITSAARRLEQVRPGWVVLAAAAESGSMVSFALLQKRLFRAGGVQLGVWSMIAITTAANAVTGTLPGGVGWAAAWQFDQFGRRGVTRFLRVWVFLVAGGVSSFALFMVIATGVETAGSHGPVSRLRWLVFLLALIPIFGLLMEIFHNSRPVQRLALLAEAETARLPGGTRLLRGVNALVSRATAVRLGPSGWLTVLALALANWLLDALVLVAAMLGLGVAVPWSAILVVYGLTQIAASVPLTPGGIGVVGGSLGALLTAYGVSTTNALSVVLLYRLLTFWLLVPIGWAVWGLLELKGRRVAPCTPRPVGDRVPMLNTGVGDPYAVRARALRRGGHREQKSPRHPVASPTMEADPLPAPAAPGSFPSPTASGASR